MSLEKAKIINRQSGEEIRVMFNPEEYSLDDGNTFAEIGVPGLKTPPIQYVRGNARSLTMELFFDTCEERRDVRQETRKIMALLEKNEDTHAPPVLLFSWGSFNFQCVLESVGQSYMLFLQNGTPVRARLNVRFKQYEPVEIESQRGFFVGSPGLENLTTHFTRDGETLSQIAGELLGDPGVWRLIADANDVENPRLIPPGISLVIPRK